MGWRGVLLLAVLVGGMAGYLMFNQPASDTPPSPVGLTIGLLPHGKNIWMAKVKLRRGPNLEPILLDLDAKSRRFLITDPVRDVASIATLKTIFHIFESTQLLEGFSAEEIAADPERVAKVGLDQPRAEIEVRYPDQTVKIEFGTSGYRDTEVYVRVDGQIKRAPVSLLTAIQHTPDELREKVLFTDLAIGSPNKVRLDRRVAGRRQVDAIERVPRAGFRIVEPKVLRADMHSVEGLVQEIGGLRVERFISGAAQRFGPETKPDLVLQVEGDGGADTLEIESLGTDDQLPRYLLARLRQRGVVFEVKGHSIGRLLRWAQSLRAKHLLAVTEPEIERVELDPGVGGKAAVLVRAASQGFRLDQPRRAEVNPKAVSEVLYALAHLEARQFVDDPPADAGLADGDPFFAVRVATRGSVAAGDEIRLGRSAGDGLVYARRADEPAAVLLPESVVAPLRRPWPVFVSLRILPKEQVVPQGLEVWSPGKETPRRFANHAGTWQQAGSTDEVGPVRDLVDRLSGLRGNQVVADPALAADQQPMRLKFMRDKGDAGDVLLEVWLYAHGQDHVLLTVKGHNDGLIYLIKDGSFRRLYDGWK